jgi:hypothetical protein
VFIGWTPGAVLNANAAIVQAVSAIWPDRTLPPDVVLDFYGRYPGQPRRVVGIVQQAAGMLLTLDHEMEPPTNPSAPRPPASMDYRFYRAAQPIAGEPTLQLPRGVAIDISREQTAKGLPSWYRLYPPTANALQAQPMDILFDPTGQVIGATGRASNRICLWVRDVSQNITSSTVSNDPNATEPTVLPPGDNSIITIYTRSGLIAAHPVDETGLKLKNWNPFRFTQDGRSSGM